MRLLSVFSIVLSFLLIGCNTSMKHKPIYFGGQIKNPKGTEVFLFKKDKKIATAKLNFEHNFMFRLDSLQSGLYQFKHGEEFQYIYLEQKDSLLIRLNTWDFDGSLVFSGKGANRNNFLIQLFIENEQLNRKFFEFFELKEGAFISKIDSLTNQKKRQYEQFQKNSNTQSAEFDDLVTAIMDFPIYSNKEKYPLHHQKIHQLEKLPQLASSFYSHREIVTEKFNASENYYTYNNYLWNKIYNTSNYLLEKDSTQTISYMLLNQIEVLVKNNDLKDAMLYQTYINSLLESCSKEHKEATKQLFYVNCTDTIKKEEVSELLKIIQSFKRDTKLPEFYLSTTQGETISSTNFLKSKTVLYFWPKEISRIQNMTKRVRFLVKKYPTIKFIGLDGQLEKSTWKSYINTYHLDKKNQFQLAEQNKGLFYTNDFPRAIIIDNGIVRNNFTFISQSNFEKSMHKIFLLDE